ILLRLLDWFAQRDLGATKISLICIGEFQGFPNFHGLGQLNAQQLATLYGTQHEVVQPEFELAKTAWRAYCSADPRNLEAVIAGDSSALPFLQGALIRHLEQYPSIRNGLSRTERQILEALETGPLRPGPLFQAEQQAEERPFMGDASFWLYVARLTKGAVPLVSVGGAGSFSLPTVIGPYDEDFLNQTLALTGKGREVLQCHEDWVQISGIDRWLGGVHLQGPESAWRWDESRNKLVAAGDICSESRSGEER
ncbi:MAG: RNA polymerase subunit sigma, partial [Armatimonadetes bacterium]|nr:RNA polymerase subunit sigma [Armatimonadota bacterium]